MGKIIKFQGEIQVFPGENIGFPEEISSKRLLCRRVYCLDVEDK